MSKNMTPKIVNNQRLKQTYFRVNFLLKNVIRNDEKEFKKLKNYFKKKLR